MTPNNDTSKRNLICAIAVPDGATASLDTLIAALAPLDNLCIVVLGASDGVATPTDWTVAALTEPFQPAPRTVLTTAQEPASVLDPIGRQYGDQLVAVRLGETPLDIGALSLAEAGAVVLAEGAQRDASTDDDLAGPPALLGETIAAMCRRLDDRAQRITPLGTQEIRETCDVLRSATGHDFKHYKDSTLSRRILRRLHVAHCDTFDAYLDLLKSDGDEARALMRDLLIGVTAFFRDTDAFTALEHKVIEQLIGPGGPAVVRIWVAGCSTGQEAYSLAMLVQDRIAATDSNQEVQIFATDLDERALSVARKGIYPAAVAEQVSPARLKRYFTKSGGRYQVNKDLRQRIVFSPHNLIADPPFSRMDLIACRNVMIYLGQHLQKKLVSLFHYALRADGYLFLGSSEAVTGHGDLFRVTDARARIAQRKETGARSTVTRLPGSGATAQWNTLSGPSSEKVAAISQRIILDEFAPPYLIVTDDGQITYASAGTDPFIQLPEGQYVNNMMRIARPGIRTGLRSAWSQALKARRKTVHEGLTVDAQDQHRRTRIIVQPMPDLGEEAGTYMVVFHDLGAAANPEGATPANPHSEHLLAQLEAELFQAREELEHSVQDLEAANEEMKSSNEELLSMNEELQSANEELEASKDEIERSNAALEDSNIDLVNLLSSTRIATIFLDQGGRLRRFTPMAAEFYNITDADIGRPLSHFTHRFTDLPPIPGAAKLRAAEDAVEHEATLEDGRIFMRRVTPYLTGGGDTSGLVVTFVDITEAKQTRDALQVSEARFRAAQQAAPDGFVMLHAKRAPTGQVVDFVYDYANAAALEIMGRDRETLIGAAMLDLFPGLKDAGFIDKYVEVLNTGTAWRYELPYRRDGLDAWFGASVVKVADGIAIGFADISDRKANELQLETSAARLQRVLDSVVAFVGVMDTDGTLYEANQPALDAAAVAREDVIGKPFWDAPWWNYDAAVQNQLKDAIARAAQGETMRYDAKIRLTGDQFIYIDFQIVPLLDEDGNVVELIPSGVNITERLLAEDAVRRNAEQLSETLDGVATLVGLLDTDGKVTDINQTAMSVVTVPKSDVIGKYFPDTPWWDISQEVRDKVADAIRRAAGGETVRQDLPWLGPNGSQLWVDFSVTPVKDAEGRVTALVPSGADISERKLAQEALEESRERLRLATRAASLGTFDFNTETGLVSWDERAREILGLARAETTFDAFTAMVHDDDRDKVLGDVEQGLDPDSAERMKTAEYRFLRPDGTDIWVEWHATFYATPQGRAVGTVQDITTRKRAQEHQALLLGELNHRVKNSLAVIQAMASQTLRNAKSLGAFREAFNGRLSAIANAHDILVGNEHSGADLLHLLRGQIGAYADLDQQVVLDGPAVTLSPTVSHALGLVLHELTTNASKYGALSVEEGRLDVTWDTVDRRDRPHVRLSWKESGGPPVTRPKRRGFGSRLIETTLSHSLDGSVEMAYDTAGFSAVLLTPTEADDDH
ncbi:MAG: CheR family methyltransferase [Pseudomonadota bacterium]